MTEQEAMERIKSILYEATAGENAVCYVTDYDEKPLKMAIKALEKQIPKVPNYSGDGYYNGEIVIDTWECPRCGHQYEVDHDDYEYCPSCGQHIDHSTLTEDD